ncbi:MAG TPA: BolA/IbaG family iron-sulfur metabolism protein [Psychromonas sp.]
MNVQAIIEKKISDNMQLEFLQVENESYRHSVPVNSETHFKVTVVSHEFEGTSLISRHRLINSLLKEELAGPVHALALHTMTPAQWKAKNQLSPNSPNCLGGGK